MDENDFECGYSNKSYLGDLIFYGTVYNVVPDGSSFWTPFVFVDDTQGATTHNESYRAILSCGVPYFAVEARKFYFFGEKLMCKH